MAKSSGLGDAFYVGGYDLSGDTSALSKIGGSLGVLDVTAINKSAFERLGGVRDGGIDWTSYFNPTGAHPVLSALPTSDVIATYANDTSSVDLLTGFVGDVLVFTEPLSWAERKAAESYLANLYAVTLSS